MGNKVEIPPVGNPENSSFVTKLNLAVDKLSDEFDSTIYRDGSQSMTGDLDLGGNRLFNLGPPQTDSEPLRLSDVPAMLRGPAGPDTAAALAALNHVPNPLNIPLDYEAYGEVDTGRSAYTLFRKLSSGTHIGEQRSAFAFEARFTGSGANGPGNAGVGVGVAARKANYPTSAIVGEIDPLSVVGRQCGPTSDMAGVMVDVGNINEVNKGYICAWESQTTQLTPGTYALEADIDVQMGAILEIGTKIGSYVNASIGTCHFAFLSRSTGANAWADVFTHIADDIKRFNVTGGGAIQTIRTALTNTAGDTTLLADFGGSTGNALKALHEYNRYAAGSDWMTSEYRIRLSVDGGVAATNSPWIALRGKAGSLSDIAFGFGKTGAVYGKFLAEGGFALLNGPSSGVAGEFRLGNVFSATATAGGGAALPATPLGYVVGYFGTTKVAIPMYVAP